METKFKNALALLLALIMVLTSVPITALATDNEEQTILETNIENVKFDYQAGEAFQASATVAATDQDKLNMNAGRSLKTMTPLPHGIPTQLRTALCQRLQALKATKSTSIPLCSSRRKAIPSALT